ncbi:MAG: hypothetical protein OXB93_00505 [Cytophagales bacterium]|nr:hypothetical protein [Cytophagales bacterium]
MKRISATLILGFVGFFPYGISAQCAVCRSSLENQAQDQGVESFNSAILYLMVIPYASVLIIAYFWYRYLQKKRIEEKDGR